MSGFVWVEEKRKAALEAAILIMQGNTLRDISRGAAIDSLQEMLKDLEKVERVEMED